MSEKTGMEETKAVFDAERPFKIRHLTPEGIKIVDMKFPSDDDWCERESRRKSIISFDGSGDIKTTREEPDEEEIALVKRLCPELVDVDPDEAGRLLDQLAFVELTNEETIIQGNRLTVRLDVLQAKTVHVFRMPTAKELEKFKVLAHDQKNISKRKVASVRNFRFIQRLYSDMKDRCEGYSGEVPIIHQFAAVVAVFAALETDLDSRQNP